MRKCQPRREFPGGIDGQERERRSARPRRREECGDTGRHATTKGQRRFAFIGYMEPDAYKPVKHKIHKSKHNIHICSRECFQVKWKEVKSVQSSIICGGCRQWCRGGPKHSAPSFAWQDDVKAAVVNAWQMSSFRHILVAGPSRLTEPSVMRIVDPQGRTEFRGTP